jgi:Na+-translocating ferredoxin:NAD+ oxidoreductase subunit B
LTEAVSSVDRIDALLPQTQCTRCGYPDCRAYASAIALDDEAINRCPPGGAEGIALLAQATGRSVVPLDPAQGEEGPLRLALIDEAWCIGCTLCLKACPVDAIVGGNKAMHTVIEGLCTGCELCIPVCPVDCISLVSNGSDRTGWSAWSPGRAEEARQRYQAHRQRLEAEAASVHERLARKAAERLGGPVPAG